MPETDPASSRRTGFEVRWNQRSFRRNFLALVLIFLAYLALAVLASGFLHVIGVAGAIVFGLISLYGGAGSVWQFRRNPVVATLDESGVTFDRHDPAPWEIFREVRLEPAKPRLFFALRPLHYVAFIPERSADLPCPTARERLAIRLYGTNLLLMSQSVTPSGGDILAAVERLSDVPVRRWPAGQAAP
jgi:hypothetical protein